LAEKSQDEQVDFLRLVLENKLMKSHFTPAEIEQLFSLEFYTRHLDQIYDRVLLGGTKK
jgi:adenylosuccinate lyase